MKRKRASLLTKLCILAFAVYAVVTLLTLQVQINRKKEENAALMARTETQTQINAKLTESLASEAGDEYAADLARDKFGLVAPGEKVFVDVSN